MAHTHIDELRLVNCPIGIVLSLLFWPFRGVVTLIILRWFLGCLMRWQLLNDVWVELILFVPISVEFSFLIFIMAKLKLCSILETSQTIVGQIHHCSRITWSKLTFICDLVRINLLDFICIYLIYIWGIALNSFYKIWIPAAFQFLQVESEPFSDPTEADHADPGPPEEGVNSKD